MLDQTLDPTWIYVTFLLVGSVTLFPFNAIVNASFYFTSRFSSSPFEDLYDSYFSMAFTITQVVGLSWQLYVVKYHVSSLDVNHILKCTMFFVPFYLHRLVDCMKTGHST